MLHKNSNITSLSLTYIRTSIRQEGDKHFGDNTIAVLKKQHYITVIPVLGKRETSILVTMQKKADSSLKKQHYITVTTVLGKRETNTSMTMQIAKLLFKNSNITWLSNWYWARVSEASTLVTSKLNVLHHCYCRNTLVIMQIDHV